MTMRTLCLGVAAMFAAFSIGTGAAAQDAAANKAKGMAMAPAMIAENKIPCKVTDAAFLFTSNATIGGQKAEMDFVEVACENDLGYVLAKRKDNTSLAYDCISNASKNADGSDGPLKCKLPGNARPYEGLKATLTAAGLPCTPTNAVGAGITDVATIIEVACANADGQLVVLPRPRSGGVAPQFVPCYSRLETSSPCALTTKEQTLSAVMALAAKAPRACTPAPTAQRFVTRSQAGNRFYEFACPDKTGYIVEASGGGAFVRAIPCTQAGNIGGGCTLTEVREEDRAKENAHYSEIAKKAGFNCDVVKYGVFPRRANDPVDKEVVEFACANRKDGGVGIFHKTNVVLNCAQARAEGYRCSYTEEALAYPQLTAALRSKGRTTCTVSGARPVGVTSTESIVEVACSDGLPGFMMIFKAGTSVLTETISCGMGSEIGGGCKLPTNQKRG